MCGRFDQHRRTVEYALPLGLPERQYGDLVARYQVAPSECPLVARWSAFHDEPELVTLRWGFIPHWSKDPSQGPRPINARAETVAEKPFFRDAFRQSRCLVPADGFFEWKRQDGKKQPYYFRLKSGEPMYFAGLWSRWQGQEGTEDTFTILVTEPNALTSQVHDRMPVILAPEHYRDWLAPGTAAEELRSWLTPYPAESMECWPVSTAVNRPKNKGPEIVAPVSNAPEQGQLPGLS